MQKTLSTLITVLPRTMRMRIKVGLRWKILAEKKVGATEFPVRTDRKYRALFVHNREYREH